MSGLLLAICVPTYNRAGQLERLLERLAVQLEDDRGDVVVLVSDNASPDSTPALLARMAERMPSLRSHRQDTNVGVLRNHRWLVANAPECDYLWLMGDDDEPEPGAIAHILGLLREHRPAWLHLPHRFVHPDGTQKTESRRPDAPEVYADPGRLWVAQTHWLTFLSGSIVRRDPLRAVAAESATGNLYFPLIWFFRAAAAGPCVIADRVLVSASTDISWGARMAEVMTHHFVGLYDEAIGALVSEAEFGRSMDAHYTRDHYWCFREAGVDFLLDTVQRFPTSRVLRRFLWSLGRELGDARCAPAVAAATAAAGDSEAAHDLLQRGEAAFANGDATAAARLFTRALEEAPALAEAWNDLAVALHALGSPEARLAAEVAVELDPTDEAARENHLAIVAGA